MTVDLRELTTPNAIEPLQELQARVWDLPHLEVVPKDILQALVHAGALLVGAFVDGALAGFVLGFPTNDPRTQHSHMLGVHPEFRRLGLALRLKLYQRDWCLARGITRVVWTYDPLKVPNAAFNIARLGATSRTYLDDYYGSLGGIDAGAPSDRLLAEWRLDAPRADVAGFDDAPFLNDPLTGRPVSTEATLALPRVRLHVPPDFGRLLAVEPDAARAWRASTGPLFKAAFAAGYRVTHFEARPHPAYLLTREDPT
ncbi:GNAT family N-acetyltransferase [Deinococcus yavapaiensis]|uniref:Putative GNAT superfamily acetyltransferase n=1 Tax=Deinococcus yavapaiensis KR-236 TaxID=694435 RepID=A0A318SB23_9DEIO|nr:GNAT family N-acetyltransferase [Deinococcus yavapaiensis]PYE53479.1 putative GNAT superfamily acetyltransferase [Deinococcus yavapaiensis KR-236]